MQAGKKIVVIPDIHEAINLDRVLPTADGAFGITCSWLTILSHPTGSTELPSGEIGPERWIFIRDRSAALL